MDSLQNSLSTSGQDTTVHRSQTYYIPDRSIMDHLFLLRDIIDVAKVQELSVGMLSIDQEKDFDRVDHNYLFSKLGAFGFGKQCMTWVKTLYCEAAVLLRVGDLDLVDQSWFREASDRGAQYLDYPMP